MKQLSIRSRVLLLAIIPGLILAILLTGFAIYNSLNVLDDRIHTRGQSAAAELAVASEYGVISENYLSLQSLVQQSMTHGNDLVFVMLKNSDGKTIAVSGVPTLSESMMQDANASQPSEWRTKDMLIFRAPVLRNVVEIDDAFSMGAEAISSRVEKRTVIGQVYIGLSLHQLSTLRNEIVSRNLILALIGLIISASIALQFGKGITRPIENLAFGVEKIGRGNLKLRVPESSEGELLTLEIGFNYMAQQLQLAHDEMQERIDKATETLSYQAHHDALTGLINRREMEARLERALKTAQEHELQHVFCYLDLDQFKVVNDTCGHHAGDDLLRQLSHLLSSRVRERDTLARLGGDEFGLLLEKCSMNDAKLIAENIREMIREFRYVYESKIFNVGASIGMVVINKNTSSIEMVFSQADSACFAAKDNGRNRIHIFEPDDLDLAKRRNEMQWVSRIAQTLEDERLRLFCQPIIPISRVDNILHYEILLRQITPEGKIVPPMAFIPAAERFGLMNAIDRWVISNSFMAYKKLTEHHTQGQRYVFSINLSGISLSDTSLLAFITDEFTLHGIPPTNICFEITETAAITNLGNTLQLMKSLKAIGCKFLLDDFGSGMSSFAYLKNLPVDYIKIDGAFVKDIVTNPIDLAMVQSVHSVAEAMQIRTIAEFVESAEIVRLLKEVGVDYGQGMFLGEPIAIELIQQLVT